MSGPAIPGPSARTLAGGLACMSGLLGLALPPAHAAGERVTVLRLPGQAVTIVADRATAPRVPALAGRLAPHAVRVGRWAGDRPPATIFLVEEGEVPDLPGPEGELPGAQLDVDRAALHLSARLVPPGALPAPPALTRVLANFLVQVALRQLAGPAPADLPVWLVLGLLDDASLAPLPPLDPRALRDAPFLELLHPSFNAPFVELLGVYPALGAAVARRVVDDLMRRRAPSHLGRLLAALRTEPFEAAFERVYGLALEAYQAELGRVLGLLGRPL